MLVCASTGVFMLQYLPSVAPSKGKAAVSYLPIALLCIAGLFYLLQPEFVPIEVSAGLYTVEYVVTVLLQIDRTSQRCRAVL